ncbi:MAG: hypothetical protein CM15mP68_6060 [Pseudomonadota bacterium]|nr:MAG: hypothetical protein CM15mP68_6060 [Pseudomonadota bacterium]
MRPQGWRRSDRPRPFGLRTGVLDEVADFCRSSRSGVTRDCLGSESFSSFQDNRNSKLSQGEYRGGIFIQFSSVPLCHACAYGAGVSGTAVELRGVLLRDKPPSLPKYRRRRQCRF